MMPLAVTWMDLEIVILSEVSQIENDKYHDTAFMQYLKKVYKWVYLQNRNKITDVENKFIVTKGERGGDKLGDCDWHIHATIFKTGN